MTEEAAELAMLLADDVDRIAIGEDGLATERVSQRFLRSRLNVRR